MSKLPPSQSLYRRGSVIAFAAFLSAPHLAEGGALFRALPGAAVSHIEPQGNSAELGTVLDGAGIVERTTAAAAATCTSSDERIEQGREELDAARAAREATRDRVVEDRLRVTQDPADAVRETQDEEDLESSRAGVNNAKTDVKQDEDLAQQRCSAASQRPRGPVNSDVVEVRMEFPARYLQPFERALGAGSVAVTAYRHSDHRAITGRLTSVESALAGDTPIVIARARLNDSLHQLRDAEPVDVAVQLPAV